MNPKRVVIQRGALEAHAPHRPRRSRRPAIGRFIALALVVLTAAGGAAVFALARQAQWRAGRTRVALRVGMTVPEVEAALAGRFECIFQEELRGGWRHLGRAEFLALFAAPPAERAGVRRMRVTFFGPMGTTAELAVLFDEHGAVRELR